MGEDEEVQKLAESLKGSGLAASMMDATNKAKEILGYSNKGVKIRVEEPKPEQKSKVDDIIKEVDEEIEQKKDTIEPVQEISEKQSFSDDAQKSQMDTKNAKHFSVSLISDKLNPVEKIEETEKPLSEFEMSETTHNDKKDVFDDPSFNVAESNMNVSELSGNDEVMTNNEKVLGERGEEDHREEIEQNIVMTNDEIKQEDNENSSQTEEDNEIDVQEQSDESDEEKEEEEGEESSREEEKPQLTEEEKGMTDLTKLFNPNK